MDLLVKSCCEISSISNMIFKLIRAGDEIKDLKNPEPTAIK